MSDSPASPGSPATFDPRAAPRPTLLLVEDNPDDEALTLRALGRGGLRGRVVVKHDGQEALDYLLDPDGVERPPAVVLLDLKLPRLDGLEVLRALRADRRTRAQPVVILTSSREDQDLVAGYDLGANSYICKPVDFSGFSEAVRQVGVYWLALNERPPVWGGRRGAES